MSNLASRQNVFKKRHFDHFRRCKITLFLSKIVWKWVGSELPGLEFRCLHLFIRQYSMLRSQNSSYAYVESNSNDAIFNMVVHSVP